MSRVTPPVTKFTQAIRRSISSTANAGRPSKLLDSEVRNAYLPLSKLDLKNECTNRQLKVHGSKSELVERLAASDLINSQSYHTMGGAHRPTPSPQSPLYRTIPLMQGFRTSAPKASRGDTSTIESFIFPEIPEAPPLNPFSKLRVPLLPDNYNTSHVAEVIDEAVIRPEISIVAAHPENVAPAAMSEVVGNDGLDVDIGQLAASAGFVESADEVREEGVIKELFFSVVEDLMGAKKGGQHKVAV